jgi:hypothetical protein
MPKTSQTWDPAEYATVAERVTAFYAAFPFGRIVTELVERDPRQVTFRAAVYRGVDETFPAATGWASEREGDGDVNTVACLENAETSAIGRALANLGFSASRRRASRDEAAHAHRRPASPGMPLRMVREPASPGAAPLAGGAGDALQQSADALLDVLLVLAEAERAGFPATRAKALRRTLEARSVPPSALARARREVMTWFETHVPVPVISTEAPES